MRPYVTVGAAGACRSGQGARKFAPAEEPPTFAAVAAPSRSVARSLIRNESHRTRTEALPLRLEPVDEASGVRLHNARWAGAQRCKPGYSPVKNGKEVYTGDAQSIEKPHASALGWCPAVG